MVCLQPCSEGSSTGTPGWPLRTIGAVGDLVAVDFPAEESVLYEGHWIAEEVHSGGDTAGSRPPHDQHCVSVSSLLGV